MGWEEENKSKFLCKQGMLLVKKEGEMGREGEKEGKGGDEFKQNEKLKKWGEDGGEGGNESK